MELTDIPEDVQYVIFQQSSQHIPGDERSRNHPGHGYPASTLDYLSPRFFPNEEALMAELRTIAKYPHFKGDPVVFRLQRLRVKTSLTCSIRS